MKSQDTAELFFENVIVPKAYILGSPGQGFIYLMQKLAIERKTFGKPVGKFQNTRFKMAEMKTEVTIGQTFVDTLVANHLKGDATPDEACMAKYGHRIY